MNNGPVGLPMDESSSSLATRAAEAALTQQIDTLQAQLSGARQDLERLRRSRTEDEPPNGGALSSVSTSPTSSVATAAVTPPPGKRGYLFKWLDRSIGWGGTKWALRFVTLESGRLAYYGSHTDSSPRYLLSLRGCAVRDDGWKRNRRHRSKDPHPPLDEPGAYFFLFSIYQRPEEGKLDSDVVPLLRFSTPSQAERTAWIQQIAEACAYAETDVYAAEEAARAAEQQQQLMEQQRMTSAMPEAKEGTLPPLIFAPAQQHVKHRRRPSFTKLPSPQLYRTRSKNFDADRQEAATTRGYPPSKPMHRAAAPSYLSVEAPVQNYRGFFNLGIIVLVVSNVRLLMASIKNHGFVLADLVAHVLAMRHFRQDPWEEFPFVSGFLLQLVFITIAYVIEWLLSRKKLTESVGMSLHHLNANSALLVPIWIVWNFIHKPPIGATLLLHASITWMKLLSYALANEDYRNTDEEALRASLALVENLEPADQDRVYPDNVTMRNMLYFWFCPSLTYQIAFPKVPYRRWWKIGGILMRMIVCVTLFTFFAAQVASPALASLVEDLEATNGRMTVGLLASYWIKLAIVNTYLWLLIFYFYFHLYLNLFAEILRFGDRVFYKDWWNSSELSAYWRLWNQPVHYWLIRHVYFPCIRHKINKPVSTLIVFTLSAIMHEVLVSVPFHMIRPWSFLGIMMQVPLVGITKYIYRKYPGTSVGNIIFWLSFCVVGQPMAVMLYTVDYQYAQQHEATCEV